MAKTNRKKPAKKSSERELIKLVRRRAQRRRVVEGCWPTLLQQARHGGAVDQGRQTGHALEGIIWALPLPSG